MPGGFVLWPRTAGCRFHAPTTAEPGAPQYRARSALEHRDPVIVKVRSQPVRDAARGRVVFAVQQRKAALNSRDNRLDLFRARPPKSGGVSHCHSGIDNLLDDVARVLGSLQEAQDHPRLNVIDAGAGRLHRRQGSLDVEPALAGPQLLLAVAVMSIALGGSCLARQQRAVGVQVEHVVEFRNVVGRAARLDGPARPRFCRASRSRSARSFCSFRTCADVGMCFLTGLVMTLCLFGLSRALLCGCARRPLFRRHGLTGRAARDQRRLAGAPPETRRVGSP